jgi:predicted ATPase/DNA-binding CsgD family transcriptional regulator
VELVPLGVAGVTRSELRIFWLVADRLRNKEIANALHVSVRTVESHVSSLLRKLGVPDRQSLVDTAVLLREHGRPGGHLPNPLSTFVGRDEETGDLLRLVRAHRMVTLTGPAGAGKTRLALHVARSVEGMPDPVLVDLATVPPGAEVAAVFADALGITGASRDERRLRAVLRDALADGPHWLLVDNCEHVAPAAADLLAALSATTSRLHVLATCHGPLGVAGETAYPVGTLPLPPDTDDPAAVLAADSGRLFADRAAAASPGFAVTTGNARAVATVCRRLDGLPLAIELAAARVRAFSPTELVTHLDDRFAVLTDGPPGRHRTLEGALSWSYRQLDHDERLLFERCSVFPGRFDYPTAADVLGGGDPPTDVAKVFPRLVDRSLVARHRHHEVTEYRLLDSVRQFAHDRLVLRGEQDAVRARHARSHLRRGRELAGDLRGGGQTGALAWFDRRWADLREAMRWALDTGRTEEAWEFLAGVNTGWEVLGARADLFDWLDRLLAEPLPTGDLGIRSAVTATVLLCYHDTRRAAVFAGVAGRLADTGADHHRASALFALGWVLQYGGDRNRALPVLYQASTAFADLGDDWHHALALSAVAQAAPDLTAALHHLARSADLFGRLRDHVKRANCLTTMAMRALDARTRLTEAAGWLTEAAELAQATGNDHEWLHAELCRATLDQRQGRSEAAAAGFADILAALRRVGDRRCIIRCLLGLGESALDCGDPGTAHRHLTEAVTIAVAINDPPKTANGLRLLARSAHATRRFRHAATLLGAADTAARDLDQANRDTLVDDGDLRTALRERLGEPAFTAALAEGHRTAVGDLVTT